MLKSLLISAWKRRLHRSGAEKIENSNDEAIRTWHKGETTAAEVQFRAIIAASPSYAPAYGNLGMVLAEQFRFDEAVSTLEEGLRKDPNHAGLHANLGLLLLRGRMIRDAIGHLERALELDPNLAEANQVLVGALLDACEWDSLSPIVENFRESAERGEALDWTNRITPYTSLLLPLDARLQQQVAQSYALRVKSNVASLPAVSHALASRHRPTLKLGYFSCDFRDHPVCHVASGLFELHDRGRFQVYAYSYGVNDDSGYREIVERGCDYFRDVSRQSTQQIVKTINDDGIDVLIDLTGYSSDARPEVLALRPAPLQVNYLGYPGTMGADFIDYLIADDYVLPPELQRNVTESVVTLPCSFFPSLRHESREFGRGTRSDAGLPQSAIVFCCFAQPSRIESSIFRAWMQILHDVPESVLWIRQHNSIAASNLLTFAKRCGIAPDRVIFAGKSIDKTAHFSRFSMADLALDTHLYNGHTTTSDALWAGVPVLTCPGNTFASRVAGSILHHLELAELICPNLDAYIEKAVLYATDIDKLNSVRAKIAAVNRQYSGADQTRYVHLLERAYGEMWSRYVQGKTKAGFHVTDGSLG